MTNLRINMTCNLIQEIRLVHALTESEYRISLPAAEESKFNALKQRFGISFVRGDNQSVDISTHLIVSHSEPLTSVGRITKPLIFPRSITSYCRTLWRNRREYRYSFQGLITENRGKLLEVWIKANLAKTIRLSGKTNLLSRIKRKVLSKTRIETSRKRQIGELLLWESDRGRKFPIKAWDDEYFRVLSNSEFVLCPSGNCIWSYRFFESALCGAIPIVEKDCSAYMGFRFLSFQDEVADLKWSQEDAEHNFKTCVERITVPGAMLDNEIASILKLNG